MDILTAHLYLGWGMAQLADSSGMGLASEFFDGVVELKGKQSTLALDDQKWRYLGKDMLSFSLSCSPAPQWATRLAIFLERKRSRLKEIAADCIEYLQHDSMVSVGQAHFAFENRADLAGASMTGRAFANVDATFAVKQTSKVDSSFSVNDLKLLLRSWFRNVKIPLCHRADSISQ